MAVMEGIRDGSEDARVDVREDVGTVGGDELATPRVT